MFGFFKRKKKQEADNSPAAQPVNTSADNNTSLPASTGQESTLPVSNVPDSSATLTPESADALPTDTLEDTTTAASVTPPETLETVAETRATAAATAYSLPELSVPEVVVPVVETAPVVELEIPPVALPEVVVESVIPEPPEPAVTLTAPSLPVVEVVPAIPEPAVPAPVTIATPEPVAATELTPPTIVPLEPVKPTPPMLREKPNLFARLKQGLSKTSNTLTEGMETLVKGKKKVDDEVLEELETRLLTADVGVEATRAIMHDLSDRVSRNELADLDALMKALYNKMQRMLRPCAQPLEIDSEHQPYVILMVGINGAGKTTTIGKLAKQFQNEGQSVMLAAGDTFRAAAVEQLTIWGQRNGIPVIAQGTGADSASVIYDAVQAAKARKIDILLADTAGRLHTQTNLMDELKKVKRVIQKFDASAPHEIMLIVDASIGQNALIQAKQFNEALGLTGITVTKLDGTAKGGILFAIAEQLKIPVRFIGVGEGIDDLQEFDAYEFTSALLAGTNAY